MKEIIQEALRRPFAALIIIGAFGQAVASIVGAAVGTPGKPFVDVTLTK